MAFSDLFRPGSAVSLVDETCDQHRHRLSSTHALTSKLLFSNPNDTKNRDKITIKASLDGGVTWLPENQILLDLGRGWGYSCLTMIDKETVGILYEGSVAHMTFQAVKLKDFVRVK